MFLELIGLVKEFNDIAVVKKLNMEIYKGELISLLGPSGCGKTTTLKMIGGFLKPDGGQIILDGIDITDIEPQKRPVATVFQSYALFPNMNVIENVTYGLKFQGYSKKEALKLGEEYLKIVGLEEYKSKNITKLSGGQQQRVALVRGLILKPKVLLLDEPLSNLDAKLRLKMREEIKELNKKFGTTMIFVTHDQEEALSISDRIAVMNHGIIEQIGSPKEIYNNPKTEFVESFIGSTNKLTINDTKISIRPEKVSIFRGENANAKIIGKQFLGSYTIYILENNNREKIKVQRLSSAEEFNVGEDVCYCIEQ